MYRTSQLTVKNHSGLCPVVQTSLLVCMFIDPHILLRVDGSAGYVCLCVEAAVVDITNECCCRGRCAAFIYP